MQRECLSKGLLTASAMAARNSGLAGRLAGNLMPLAAAGITDCLPDSRNDHLLVALDAGTPFEELDRFIDRLAAGMQPVRLLTGAREEIPSVDVAAMRLLTARHPGLPVTPVVSRSEREWLTHLASSGSVMTNSLNVIQAASLAGCAVRDGEGEVVTGSGSDWLDLAEPNQAAVRQFLA